MLPSRANILFKLTGSIACYKACDLISKLVQQNYNVQCVASKSALKFIGEATLEGLTSRKVLVSEFETNHMMQHIHLVDWADLTILCPGSAKTINQMAAGVCEGLLGSLFLAHDFKKPYLIAPSMNHRMLSHPILEQSIERLKALGIHFIFGEEGFLACKHQGKGRLCEPIDVKNKIESLLKVSENKKGSVLITSGGTDEPIDSVRFISNFSTGKTAASIADSFLEAGYQVYYICHERAQRPKNFCETIFTFKTYSDLYVLLKDFITTTEFKIMIHAAAVSDYSVESIYDEYNTILARDKKITSDNNVILKLKKNPKILNLIKEEWGFKGQLVAFKLTSSAHMNEITTSVEKVFKSSDADLVVHNDLSEIAKNYHKFSLYSKEKEVFVFSNKAQLGEKLLDYCEKIK